MLEPPILLPPVEGRPLIMYLTVLDKSMGCILGQQDETGKKEFSIYYLIKKFTDCESRYSTLKKNMLCFGLGGKAFAVVYVESHYLVDLQNGSNQVYF